MSQPHQPKTAQDIFNTVAMHLMTQGERSTGAMGLCRYRGSKGHMCAIGVLIPDEMYNSSMEGKTVGTIQNRLPAALRSHLPLLDDLQIVHDFCDHNEGRFNRGELKRSLKGTAKRFGLECEVLKVM